MNRIKRPVLAIKTFHQNDLFGGDDGNELNKKRKIQELKKTPKFRRPNPDELYLGVQSFENYLKKDTTLNALHVFLK